MSPMSPEVRQLEPRRVIRMDHFEAQFEYFTQRGVFFLDSEIEEGMPTLILMALLRYHRDADPIRPVWVVLNSPGGSVHQGFAIYDTLRMIEKMGRTVNILSIGAVASMATFILQAGTHRYSLPHSQFLIHEVSDFSFGSEGVSEGEERLEEKKRLNSILMSTIARRSGANLTELSKKAKKKDYWLDAQAARELGPHGLIDKIVDTIPFEF